MRNGGARHRFYVNRCLHQQHVVPTVCHDGDDPVTRAGRDVLRLEGLSFVAESHGARIRAQEHGGDGVLAEERLQPIFVARQERADRDRARYRCLVGRHTVTKQ
jgi:hypothetical protein